MKSSRCAWAPPPGRRPKNALSSAVLVQLLILHLRNIDCEVRRMPVEHMRLPFGHRPHATHLGALRRLASGDVEPRLVHVEVVLRVRGGRLEAAERGPAGAPRQELQQHEGLAVRPAADLPEHAPELQGRALDEAGFAACLQPLLLIPLVVVVLVLLILELHELVILHFACVFLVGVNDHTPFSLSPHLHQLARGTSRPSRCGPAQAAAEACSRKQEHRNA
mmetsp:Transcript_98941/g.221688  ORF Transcript_98941/g.221688 Transcript_98941/m.221688 type:complete len:221 (+) Transcript_98941:78-740(+)